MINSQASSNMASCKIPQLAMEVLVEKIIYNDD